MVPACNILLLLSFFFCIISRLLFQKADTLGYKTHAHFVLDMRMAKDPETVAEFLSSLANKLQVLKKEEIELFLSYKKEEVMSCLIRNIFENI